MSTITICDVCQQPITGASVQWGDGDYHDRPECIGAVQAAIAGTVQQARTQLPK
jgi:hypothetical protein